VLEERTRILNKKAVWEAVARVAAKKDIEVNADIVEEEIENFFGDDEDEFEEIIDE
jgi:hypothetical protein